MTYLDAIRTNILGKQSISEQNAIVHNEFSKLLRVVKKLYEYGTNIYTPGLI